ncbi:MAG: dihydrodipicolinate synthase family protein, partial [Euzebyales bacterium]|nr:dihydrodipicolinate synthase family protein [Euzebyales bacterium]
TEACGHARAAAAAGAEGLLALPPLYWKLGDSGLLRHYEAIAAATDLPVVLYDFPSLAGTALTPPLVQRIAERLERVIGIKQSGPELGITHAVLRCVKPRRPDFAVLTGAADLVLPGLLAGTDGTIAAIANVDPVPVAGVFAAVAAGDLAAATAHHRRILELLALPRLSSPPILALKVAAAAFGSPLQPAVRSQPDDPNTVVAGVTALAERLRQAPG